MRPKQTLVLLISLFSALACSHTAAPDAFNTNPVTTLKEFITWWEYNYRNIKLAEDYTAFDTASQPISKKIFLENLATGKYVAFRLGNDKAVFKYQLYKLAPATDENIASAGSEFGKNALQCYELEGTKIPDFNFTDINGKVYNRETTRGKIVILKCWFIACQVCVEEMPALNEIVKQYRNRDDVIFISIAFDTKEALQAFTRKRKFDYAVIPVSKDYLFKTLKVHNYPTQFIINKEGLIEKVVTEYKEMGIALDRLAKRLLPKSISLPKKLKDNWFHSPLNFLSAGV